MGGPSLHRLQEEIDARLADGGPFSAAELFAELDDDLRRPVEVFGLLHLLVRMDATIDRDARELVTTVRPDGSVLRLLLPTVTAGTADDAEGDSHG